MLTRFLLARRSRLDRYTVLLLVAATWALPALLSFDPHHKPELGQASFRKRASAIEPVNIKAGGQMTQIGAYEPPRSGLNDDFARHVRMIAADVIEGTRRLHRAMTSPTASAKVGLRALAQRWLMLDAEIKSHDANLDALNDACAPTLKEARGMATGTAAEMLILVGDNPERIRSEAAFAKLCGACPIPASSGKTSRHHLNRGGHRQANAALYRVVIIRMRSHLPTLDYVRRRTAEGKGKMEIIRCLKRFVAREIFGYLCRASRPPTMIPSAS
jgi:hypothetical protein